MHIDPFEMERWQSTWEHHVEVNLSDSGVHPVTLREFLTDDELDQVLNQRLIYTQTNGTPELRRAIAALHPGADESNVQVTSGGAEANFVAAWTVLEPGDEVVAMVPNYQQVHGLAAAFAGTVRPWPLEHDRATGRWSVDLDMLGDLVNARTKLIAICNPNNPTGMRFDANMLDAIAEIADRHGTWVLADEIYRGAEFDGVETPTMWGRSPRVIVTNSLSKSYGLPGMRLGWMVAPPQTRDEFWLRHDYTTIAPNALADLVATWVLTHHRAPLLARAREILTGNFAHVSSWLDEHADIIRYSTPDAGGMLWLAYDLEIGSTELADRLRAEHDVLLVPGDQYGMDHHLRIGFGGELDHVQTGLDRLATLISVCRGHATA